jgi:sugar phosphate isomerase/epimerase
VSAPAAGAASRPLGLHQITATDLDPLGFVEIAAAAGYQQVSLFTHNPVVPLPGQQAKFVFPTVTPGLKRDIRAALDANGLQLTGAEFFLIRPDGDLESYRAGLATGRELGARHAVTHVFDDDPARAADTLGAFCEMAAAEELIVGIEFCQMTPGCKSIGQAQWFVDQVGAGNLGFGICPLHLTRSGGTPEDVAALPARYFAFGQINDGRGRHASAEYYDEVHDRELPGDGDFPLRAILSALPAALPIEVKIPSDRRRAAGRPALDYVREAARRSRALLETLEPAR